MVDVLQAKKLTKVERHTALASSIQEEGVLGGRLALPEEAIPVQHVRIGTT